MLKTYPYSHHKQPEDIQKLSDGESESVLYHGFVPIGRSSNSFSPELRYIIIDNVYLTNSMGGRIRFRRLLCLFLVIFLIINTTTPAAADGINTPTSITPEEALELLIKNKHTENLPSCEKCREIGYKYDQSRGIWEIRGGYSFFSQYHEYTIKIKANNDDVRKLLLEYIYYVNECTQKHKDGLTLVVVASPAIVCMAAGPVGLAVGGATIIGLLIALDDKGKDMDKCTEYAKIIYNKLKPYKELYL